MTFRYTLEKGSKVWNCPRCNRRKLVRYVNVETGEYAPPQYGRCNAESSCGYLLTVPLGTKAERVTFKRIKSVSEKSYVLTDNWNGQDFVPKSQVMEIGNGEAWISSWFIENSKLEAVTGGEPKYFNSAGLELVNDLVDMPDAAPLQPSYHDPALLRTDAPDNLTKWLGTRFTPQEVKTAKAKYDLGGIDTPWPGSTIYYQQDIAGKIRGAKILHHNVTTGRRTKEPYPRITWLHSVLKIEDFQLVQTLYGMNQAAGRPNAEIHIYEGEKTAVYLSIMHPEELHLATGSKSGLKASMLESIKNRAIVVHPDAGAAYSDWKSKAEALNKEGFNITVSDFLERTGAADGTDLLDYYENLKK